MSITHMVREEVAGTDVTMSSSAPIPIYDAGPHGRDAVAEQAVRDLLHALGVWDENHNGLKDTPGRVVRAWRETLRGYGQEPHVILGRVFDEPHDEMVVLRNVRFYSTCEHHLLPFSGTATVGYIPGKVVGISKLARLVECYAHRLQIQERLTRQIADAVETHLNARGVGVLIRAHHLCMGCRGVRQPEAEMVTSALLGYLRVDDKARTEFLLLSER